MQDKHSSNPKDPEKAFRELIESSHRIVFFSGAGISTESGISDYRSQGGIWNQFQPVTIQEFLADESKRVLYWQRKKHMFEQMRNAKPNKTHDAMIRLQQKGKLLGAITQNIDGLHKIAGIQNVLEIHGTNREVICLECGVIGPFDPVFDRINAGENVPRCEQCEGLLKPNTISFGQSLDMEVLEKCYEMAQGCDLMIAAGSTLIVEPAASLPSIAKNWGAPLVIINHDPTPHDNIADLVFRSSVGALMERVVS